MTNAAARQQICRCAARQQISPADCRGSPALCRPAPSLTWPVLAECLACIPAVHPCTRRVPRVRVPPSLRRSGICFGGLSLASPPSSKGWSGSRVYRAQFEGLSLASPPSAARSEGVAGGAAPTSPAFNSPDSYIHSLTFADSGPARPPSTPSLSVARVASVCRPNHARVTAACTHAVALRMEWAG